MKQTINLFPTWEHSSTAHLYTTAPAPDRQTTRVVLTEQEAAYLQAQCHQVIHPKGKKGGER